jgi:hypothetical protein
MLHVANERRGDLTRQACDLARRLLKLLPGPLEVALERRLIALLGCELLLLLFLRLLLGLLLIFLSLLLRLLSLLLRFLFLLLWVVAGRLPNGGAARKTER